MPARSLDPTAPERRGPTAARLRHPAGARAVLTWALAAAVVGSALVACSPGKDEAKPGAAAPGGGAPGAGGAGAPPAPPPPPVGVQAVQSKSVPIVRELPGRTSPYLIAEVRPQVNGILRKRLFEEGAMVKAGQPLYEVASEPYRAAADSAQAAVARAQATLAANRVKAERLKTLADISAVSRQSYDDAAASVQQSVADLGVAKAQLETARVNLGYTTITAPIDGRVSTSAFTVGALLTANQANALTTIQQLDPIYVDITQSSNEMLQLQRALASGQLTSAGDGAAVVKLILSDGTSYSRDGKLTFSGATVDPTTGSVTMRAVFPNPDRVLLPGMFGRAVLDQGMRPNSILVAQRAVMRDPTGNATVMTVGEGNKVEPRPVKVGEAVGDQYVIESGLKDGDRVIVDGLQKVKPGAAVTPMPAGPTGQPQGQGQPANR